MAKVGVIYGNTSTEPRNNFQNWFKLVVNIICEVPFYFINKNLNIFELC